MYLSASYDSSLWTTLSISVLEWKYLFVYGKSQEYKGGWDARFSFWNILQISGVLEEDWFQITYNHVTKLQLELPY